MPYLQSSIRPARPCPLPRALPAAAVLLLGLALARISPAGVDARAERPLGPGVRLLQWALPDGPNALYAVEVDASQPFIRLGVSLGKDGALGLEPLSRQAARLTRADRYPIAAVNGDYFYYPNRQQPGIPTNAAVVDGELVRTPFNRSCLILGASGPPSIRILACRARVVLPGGMERPLDGVNQPRGANQLVLYTPRYGQSTRAAVDGVEVVLEPEQGPLRPGVTHRAKVRGSGGSGGSVGSPTPNAGYPLGGPTPNAESWILSGSGAAGALLRGLRDGDAVEVRVDLEPPVGPGDQVLGGGPRLVRDGKVSVEQEGGTLGRDFVQARVPRTAVGFNGSRLYLVVVDGRQPGFSAGMSLPELAQVMVDLGCTDAMNLDGGGSSTLWARGSVVNRPSDGSERPVANGLLVFSTAPTGAPARLVPMPAEIRALAGAEVVLSATAEDRYYNPVPPGSQIRWSVDPEPGSVHENRFTAGGAGGNGEVVEGKVLAEAGGLRGEIPVRVHARPARVEVLPATLRVGTAAQSAFRLRAYDGVGRSLLLPAQVRWETTGEIGSIGADGVLSAAAAAGRGAVRATVNGVTAEAAVEVIEGASRGLEDFEGGEDWKLQASGGATGKVSLAQGTARGGRRALRLEYDFTAGTGTRALYALGSRPLGTPLALKLWVFGDGQGAWLRLRLRDAQKTARLLDIARQVDWSGSWREIRVPISEDFPGPLALEAIYVVETDAERKPKGAVLIDDLSVE